MSGRKETLITMTSSEADRLRNSARWAQESEQQAIQREQAVQNALNAANRERDALNRALSNEIAGLHGDIKNMANEQNRRFREQADEYNSRLQQQRSEMDRKINDVSQQAERNRQELQGQIEKNRQELQSQINRNRQELQSQINGISARIEAKEKDAKKLAEFWISQTQAYLADIEQYRHEMFAPGRIEKIKGKLNQMLSDINSGMYEAAIATARSLFNEAVDVKEAVLSAETEWLYYQGLFLKALAETNAKLSYHENLQFTFEREHGTETVDAKVNYWTNGALNEVSASLSEIKQKTERIQSVPTQQLIDYIDVLSRQNIKMEAAADEAKEAIFSSQRRAEVANNLADALEEVMWKCERITYVGEEQNQPVHVKLSDGMGNEIVAIISPEISARNMDYKLELNFFDKRNDETQRQEWIASIQNGLQQEGLVVGEAVCIPGYETRPSDNTAVRDIDATARRVIERAGAARHGTSMA